MKLLYKVAGLLFLSIFFFQCQKDLSYIGSPDQGASAVSTPDPIKANLQVNIVDENNQPAAGVTITVGTKTAMTNGSGYSRITDAPLDKNTSLVTAEKAGYFKGSRVFAATSGTNQVVIKLVKRNLAGTITASSGGSASLSNGAKISLPANGVIVASSGSAYLGDVNVYASYIDPKASDIGETVPGSFVANDKNGKRVILSSYGMLAVELESSAGEKLQIKSGAVATLTSPIPSSSLSSAPATIALWYVEEQTGIWKEEGTATKQGNNYVGDVKHFSFWNCDYPSDAVNLSMTLHNINGLPLVGVHVVIMTDSGSTGHGWTDSLGQVKGLVPSKVHLLLQVLDNCQNPAYSKDISPLSQNTDLGVLSVTGSSSLILTFEGTLLDCNGLPVKKGYAVTTFNNFIRYAATDATGKFETSFIICPGIPANAFVLGVDETSKQQSKTSTVSVTASFTNAGNITACGISAEQFINYTLDGTDYSIGSAANDTIEATNYSIGPFNETSISGSHNFNLNNSITFTVDTVTATGTLPINKLHVHMYNPTILTLPFNVTFTNYPNVAGEFYEGSFSGKFTDSVSATAHTISSKFKVRRIN